MKAILSIIFLFIFSHFLWSQNIFKNCKFTYFEGSKKITSSICYDDNDRFGEAKVFKNTGEIIYQKQLRKIAGHANVTFNRK